MADLIQFPITSSMKEEIEIKAFTKGQIKLLDTICDIISHRTEDDVKYIEDARKVEGITWSERMDKLIGFENLMKFIEFKKIELGMYDE